MIRGFPGKLRKATDPGFFEKHARFFYVAKYIPDENTFVYLSCLIYTK
jgi:hypothetical protein